MNYENEANLPVLFEKRGTTYLEMREAIVAYRYLCELQQAEEALKKNEEEFIPKNYFCKK